MAKPKRPVMRWEGEEEPLDTQGPGFGESIPTEEEFRERFGVFARTKPKSPSTKDPSGFGVFAQTQPKSSTR